MPQASRGILRGFVFTSEAVLVVALVGSLAVFAMLLLISNTAILQPRGVPCSDSAVIYISFASLSRPGFDAYTAATGVNTILGCSIDVREYVFTKDGVLAATSRSSIGRIAPGAPGLATCIFSTKLDPDNPLQNQPDEKLYCYYVKASSR